MGHDFDPGYPRQGGFARLVRDYPGPEVYPPADFRVEWGPIFHRGRLDGTARILVIGQDPAAHETITRRILVGEAGQRIQGFLAKLGIDRSYVMINTYLYAVYGQAGGNRHRDNAAIAAHRHRWLDAILATQPIEAIVALGGLADHAIERWRETPTGKTSLDLAYRHITHPTYPESASAARQATKAAAMAAMLANWNQALDALASAITHRDTPRPLRHYGTTLGPDDVAPIPERDLPPGLPAWMRAVEQWAWRRAIDEADRPNATPAQKTEAKRAAIAVRIPRKHRIWTSPGALTTPKDANKTTEKRRRTR